MVGINAEGWSAIGSAATAVTVAFTALQIALSRRHERTEFEDGLVKEYRELLAILPPEVLLQLPEADDPELVRKHLPVYYRYFDLCNEQIFLRQKGRVRKDTWREWRSGIVENLERSGFRAAWALVEKQTDSFAELRALRRKCDVDPKSRRWESERKLTIEEMRAARARSIALS